MTATITRILVRLLDKLAPKRKSAESTPEHLLTGRHGEDAAYFHLRQLGYSIIARNWRSRRRKGELDLIGWDADTLCFIEVKTRSTRDVKPAEAAVGREKQRELRAMAREYLWRASRSRIFASQNAPRSSSLSEGEINCRFDVVSVYYDIHRHSVTDITLFRNSFPVS